MLKLLHDRNFLLLHVGTTIKVVNPYDNGIKELEYRCMSHMWGEVEKYVWDNHGIVGIDYPIQFRPEKRERLLDIMREFGGYWWVDLLCIDQTREDKPLYLMQDIYKYCKECIAMTDCPIDVLDRLASRELASVTKKMLFLTIAYIADSIDYCMTEMFYEDPCFNDMDLLEISVLDARTLADDLKILFKSTWFTRIWTLQESVLPSVVLLTCETMDFRGYIDLSHLLDVMQELRDYLCRYGYASSDDFKDDNPTFSRASRSRDPYDSDEFFVYEDNASNISDKLDEIPNDRDDDIYLHDKDFKNVYNSIKNITRLKNTTDRMETIKVITGLDRRCKYSWDYFHGISGLLGMTLNTKLGVRGLFYMFVENLADMDIAWEMPNWTKEHELYKYIICKDLAILERSNTISYDFIKIIKLYNGQSSGVLDVKKLGIRWEGAFTNIFEEHRQKYIFEDFSLDKMRVNKNKAEKSVVVQIGDIRTNMSVGMFKSLVMKSMKHPLDKKCEMISELASVLQQDSYVYFTEAHPVIFSRVYIGKKFGLRKAGITKDGSVCKLAKNSRVIGAVYSTCGCVERLAYKEKMRKQERLEEMFLEYRDDVDGDADFHKFARQQRRELGW